MSPRRSPTAVRCSTSLTKERIPHAAPSEDPFERALGKRRGTRSALWAVGYNGVSLHYNGNAWNTVPNGATQNLFRVTGSSASNVWAAGPGGAVIK